MCTKKRKNDDAYDDGYNEAQLAKSGGIIIPLKKNHTKTDLKELKILLFDC